MKYQVLYKKNKKLYARVNEEGIIVTAPYGTAKSIIENFLFLNEDKLLKLQKRYEKVNVDENLLYLFGNLKEVVFHDYYKFKYEVSKKVHIFGKQDKETLKKRFLKSYSQQEFSRLNQKLYEQYLVDDFDFCEVSVKSWKNTYGKYYRGNKIVLNYKLIHLKKNAFYHVLLHEYCHEKEMNHSKKFYQLLARYDQEYKKNRKYIIDNINKYC